MTAQLTEEAIALLEEWAKAVESHPFVELASQYPDLARLYVESVNFNMRAQQELDNIRNNEFPKP